MDESNEINKTRHLSRFFDRSSINTNPFGSNQSAERAYRRAERLVAGVYLLTNHVSHEEPLRKSIRLEALAILEKIMLLRDDMRASDSPHANACRASIRYLISLVRTLSVAGFISFQNTDIVTNGLDELGNFLEVSKGSSLSENVHLTRGDFLGVDDLSVKDIKDKGVIKDRRIQKDVPNVSDTVVTKGGLSVREQGIVGILRAGGEFGIRDIASNLPEYSEKMIQRDLLRLVGAGHIKKVGLKRWSRYSI